MKKVKIAIIGCGRRMKDILRLFLKENTSVEIVALADEEIKYAEDYNQEFGFHAPTFTDTTEALKTTKPDWAFIGSRNFLHAGHILEAFRHNIHVFVEKPLAISKEDCFKIYQTQKEKNLDLVIGFTLRYSLHYRKIAKLLHEGAIGKILSFEFNENIDFWHGTHIMCNWRRLRKYTGFHLLEKCCHDIDIANWFLQSKVKKVASFGGLNFFTQENKHLADSLKEDTKRQRKPYIRYGLNAFDTDKDIIDNQVVIMEYENGARGTFHTNLNSGIPERRFYILGTKGSIRSDLVTGKIELKMIGFNETAQDVSLSEELDGHGGGDEILAKELLDCLLNQSTSSTTAKDGLISAITCFAIDDAQRENRVVSLDSDWEILNKIG